jgi:PAS domain S-box-containing protein
MSKPLLHEGPAVYNLVVEFRTAYIASTLRQYSRQRDERVDSGLVDSGLSWIFTEHGDTHRRQLPQDMLNRVSNEAEAMFEQDGYAYFVKEVTPHILENSRIEPRYVISYAPTDAVVGPIDHNILTHVEIQWALIVGIYLLLVLLVLMRQIILNKQEVEQISHLIADYSHDGVIITDSNKKIIYCNPTMELITGYQRSELIGFTPGLFSVKGQSTLLSAPQEEDDPDRRYTTVWDGTLWDKGKRNEYFLTHLSVRKLENKQKITRFFIGTYTHPIKSIFEIDDVTQSAERIEHKQRDAVPQMLIERACENAGQVSVIAVKIANFDRLETQLSNDESYLFSNAVAARMRRVFDLHEAIAVYDPGSYLIICAGLDGTAAHDSLDRLCVLFEQPLLVSSHAYDVQLIGGIASYPEHGNDGGELLFKARIALGTLIYTPGKSQFLTYDEQMYERIKREMEILRIIPQALDNGEIEIWYQPQVSFEHGGIVGAEALSRWFDDKLGYISPAQWIPLAERAGYGPQVFRNVFERVCTFAARLNRNRETPVQISFNISAEDLLDEQLLETISSRMQESGVNPAWLKAELTESVIMEDLGKADMRLKDLQRLGLATAIDDFGTGFSSFSYLEHLALDVLKIDRSFIKGYPEDSDGTVVRAIINMAKELGMEVIAEGVETQQQFMMLEKAGCDQLQGYIISPAVSADKLEQMCRAREI